MTVTRRSFTATTNVSGTSASTITVTKPTDLMDGELMLAFTNGPVGTVTAPAGWTLVGSYTSADGTSTQSNLYKKIASSEGASWQWTFPSSSACGVAMASFLGAYDVLTWDCRPTGAGATSHNTRLIDCARDCVAISLVAWKDATTATMTVSQGSEEFDTAAANTGSTIFRGLCGSYYGPGVGGLTDIINVGDSLPTTLFTSSVALDGSCVWVVAVDNKAPDAESWTSTNGAFDVELKLDELETDSTGSVTSLLKGDVTGLVQAVTSSHENLPNEGDEKLMDGLASTKWLGFADTTWVQYDFGSGNTQTIRRYRLTSANDAETRDPYNWILKGSNNGTDFTNLDTRTAQAFAQRGETVEFNVTSPGAYRYYRLDISTNRGPTSATSTQLAEWRVSTHAIWEDVTEYVREEDKIRITRGVQGASGRSDFSRAYVTLDNRDGRFSLKNQDGAYYGSLQRNTQMRISKAYGTKGLQLQGAVRLEGTNMCGDGVRCALTNSLQITGDIDVRIDLEPESWRDEQMLCGIQTQNNQTAPLDSVASWSLHLDANGQLDWGHSPGSGTVSYKSTVAVPQSGRLAIRVTIDVDNGASGSTATFYTAPTIAGPWTQLGEPVVNSGTTDISYWGGALCVGHVGSKDERGIHGTVYHFELYNGIAGSAVTDVDFTALTNGAHSFTDSNSNRWVTINNAVISNRRYRFHGEVAEWPIAWDPTGTDIYCSITGAGVQRRWERTTWKVSTMRRYHTKAIIEDPAAFERYAEPAAYWPMEDKKGVYRIASGLPGKPGMQLYSTTTAPKFEEEDGRVFNESNQLMRLGDAKMGGRVVGATSGYADIRWVHHTASDPGPDITMLELYGTGTVKRWVVSYTSSTQWRVRGYDEDDSGSAFWDSGSQTMPILDEPCHFQLLLDQDGSNVSVTLTAYDVYGEQVDTFTDSFLVATVGRITWVNINPNGDANDTYMGHMAVYGTNSPPITGPINAYHYETAGNRIKRLTDETRVEFRHIGTLDTTAFMGYFDADDTSFSSMHSAAVSDEGYLIDPLDAFGIEYRTLRSVFNQAPHLTLSYSSGELSNELRPVEDDSFIVNDFTASRGGAGSRRYRLTSGPLSVDPPPNGVNTYDDEQSYSLAHEGQCVDLASWQVHKGTLDEERFPRIELALENLRIAADTALIEALLKLDVGDRVDITDTPDFLAPQDIRQIVVGYEEWFDNFQHNFKLNTQPERLYEVAEYDNWSHFDADEAELYQDITSTAESITVVSGDIPFTTDPESYPFLITVDGEQMTALNAGTISNEDPLFDTGVTHWGGQNCTVAVETSVLHPHPLCTQTLKATPDGVNAVGGPLVDLNVSPSVSVQNEYTVSYWILSPTGWSDFRAVIDWYTSGDVFISTSSSTAVNLDPNKWTFIEETGVVAPATAAKARMRCRYAGTPAASDFFYVWNCKVTEDPPLRGNDQGDSFNRADSTTNLGSTDRGTVEAWTQNAGTWGINSNAAYISAAATSIATLTGTADFEELSMTVSTWASGEAFLVFRYTDTSNYMRFGGTVGAAATLITRSAGADTATDTADGTDGLLAAGDVLRVRCNGSVIECFRNDRLILCVSRTTNETATRVGMRLATTAPRLNDFYFQESGVTQELSVERGYNAAASYHKAGAKVALTNTPYRGM